MAGFCQQASRDGPKHRRHLPNSRSSAWHSSKQRAARGAKAANQGRVGEVQIKEVQIETAEGLPGRSAPKPVRPRPCIRPLSVSRAVRPPVRRDQRSACSPRVQKAPLGTLHGNRAVAGIDSLFVQRPVLGIEEVNPHLFVDRGHAWISLHPLDCASSILEMGCRASGRPPGVARYCGHEAHFATVPDALLRPTVGHAGFRRHFLTSPRLHWLGYAYDQPSATARVVARATPSRWLVAGESLVLLAG